MRRLLTIASAEFDGASWWRWMPVQERDLWLTGDHKTRLARQTGAGIMLGDMGNLYLFTCQCEQGVFETTLQSS